MTNSIRIGDKVCFAKSFLKGLHASATDDIWRERGIVEQITTFGAGFEIAHVRGFSTENSDGIAHVNVSNLAKIGSLRQFE